MPLTAPGKTAPHEHTTYTQHTIKSQHGGSSSPNIVLLVKFDTVDGDAVKNGVLEDVTTRVSAAVDGRVSDFLAPEPGAHGTGM